MKEQTTLYAEQSDSELVRLAKNGDRSAEEALVLRFGPVSYTHLLSPTAIPGNF